MGKLVLLAICKAQTLCLGSAPSLPVLHRELEENNNVQKKLDKFKSVLISADLEKNGGQKCSTGQRFTFAEVIFTKSIF